MTTAVYITQRGLIQMHNGQVVSPTEFERMSGKAASKKWKASIRIDKVCPLRTLFSLKGSEPPIDTDLFLELLP